MSRIFDKFFSKIIAVIVVVLFVVGFRDLLADKEFYTVFGSLMGTLPFAKVITDTICKLLNYQNSVPIITTTKFLGDVLKLAVMACIQPFVVAILSRIFLRVPGETWVEQEEYMNGALYKIKELAMTVFSAPFIALAAAYLSTTLSTYIASHYGSLSAAILGILSVSVLSLISIIPLLIAGTSVLTAVLWRVVVTLLMGMATTYVTNALCLALYIALLRGVHTYIFGSIVALIIWLIIVDLGMKLIRYSIAGTNHS